MNGNNKQIIECLDLWMEQNNKTEISAVQAAEILDKAGLLKDSKSRAGQPLRKKLRNSEIPHAYQNGVHWYIPRSNSFRKIAKENILKPTPLSPQNAHDENKELSIYDISILLDKRKFQAVRNLSENDVPNTPGLYSIRIKDLNMLPKEFRNELVRRNETLLYIGKATKSLRKRLWEEELHAQRPATFFRTIGAVLGFLPPKGSLKGRSNQCNYRFSSDDNTRITKWIENNLLINFVKYKDDIDYIEKDIIKKAKPIMNIQNNLQPFDLLIELRKKCRDIARS